MSGSEPCVQVGQKYAGIHIENMDNVSMDSKQACPKHWLSRKVHHPGPLITVTSQKQRYSIAFLISTIRNFVITWLNKGANYRSMYKKSSMNILNVVDWSMGSFVCNALPATMNGWLRSAVNGAVSVPAAVPCAWLKAQPCWWTKSCRINPYGNGC